VYKKVKFILKQVTKTQRGSRGIALHILEPRRQVGWVVNATPRPLYPRKRLGTHCIGGWVGPRTGLDGFGMFRRHQDSIPGPSSPSRVAILTELSRPQDSVYHGIHNICLLTVTAFSLSYKNNTLNAWHTNNVQKTR
jgi:hypothetical protein